MRGRADQRQVDLRHSAAYDCEAVTSPACTRWPQGFIVRPWAERPVCPNTLNVLMFARQQRERAHLHQGLTGTVGVQRCHARQARVAREQQIQALLRPASPTITRDGRIRRLSLTRSRNLISPVPSSPCCRVCMATQSGWLKRSTSFGVTHTTSWSGGVRFSRGTRASTGVGPPAIAHKLAPVDRSEENHCTLTWADVASRAAAVWPSRLERRRGSGRPAT